MSHNDHDEDELEDGWLGSYEEELDMDDEDEDEDSDYDDDYESEDSSW